MSQRLLTRSAHGRAARQPLGGRFSPLGECEVNGALLGLNVGVAE